LQKELAIQLNLQTTIVDGVLSYKDQVFVWFQKGAIQLKGCVSEEYFQIRKLMYCHFGRM
jgi:hypothetical protein